LSTLTKVLVVLLTISSIFLCGIVCTYVATAENFREKYKNQNSRYQAATRNEENAKKQLNQTVAQANQLEENLKGQINKLQIQVNQLQTQVAEARRQAAAALEQENKWRDINIEFSRINDEKENHLKQTLAELNNVKAQQIENERELEETTASLIEKMAIIDDLETKLRQLREEKTALQNNVNRYMQRGGKTITAPMPVTTTRDRVRVAPPATDIGLKGRINAVNLETNLAEISIGAAHGVKQGMRFHAVRGDRFICDIVILDVQPEKAIGTLELMKVTQEQPKIGDNVSTNL
jgi:hypothetical protein